MAPVAAAGDGTWRPVFPLALLPARAFSRPGRAPAFSSCSNMFLSCTRPVDGPWPAATAAGGTPAPAPGRESFEMMGRMVPVGLEGSNCTRVS